MREVPPKTTTGRKKQKIRTRGRLSKRGSRATPHSSKSKGYVAYQQDTDVRILTDQYTHIVHLTIQIQHSYYEETVEKKEERLTVEYEYKVYMT